MFRGADVLAAAIDDVAVAPTGEAIAEARRLLDRLEAKVAAGEAEYSTSGGYEADGSGTMASYLRHECSMTTAESSRVASRAKKLAHWPEVVDAWNDGQITGTQVDVMTVKVPDRHVERLAITAAETVSIVEPLTTWQTQKALTRWVRLSDVAAEREAAEAGIEPSTVVPERELSASRSLDDLLFVNGSFDADSAVFIEKALTAAGRADAVGERRTAKEKRADALVEVCRGYLAALENPDGNRDTERLTIVADIVTLHRAALRGAGVTTASQLDRFLADRPDLGIVEIGVFLDAFDGLGSMAHTLDGKPVSDALLSMVSSGGSIERLLTVDGRVLDHGRSIRSFTAAQRRAILTRDGGCRTAGCRAGPDRCDVHHVIPWELGGLTDIANGVAKCRRCHLEHHRKRWRDRLDPDGTYTVVTSEGTELVSRPPGWHDEPRLPVCTTAESAREPAFIHDRRRPRCDCPCPEHRGPEEEAEFQESRRLVLARFDAAA